MRRSVIDKKFHFLMLKKEENEDGEEDNRRNFSGRLAGGRRFHLKVSETAHLKKEHKAVLLGAGCLHRKYTQESCASKAVCTEAL